MKRTFLLIALALAGSAAIVMTAGATSTATPGVTAKTILLEGTFPLSGPASGYAPIPAGMGAYFSYANAQGGVNGRKIIWKYEDDGYNPANTVQITHKFVEQDHAFALVGGLGTEPQTAVRQYLNDNKVPQLFVSTGATTFDHDSGQYPWTIGWQPDYAGGRRDLRQVRRAEPPEREARHRLPERRLRQELPERIEGGPRLVARLADRRRRTVRRHGAEPGGADREAEGVWRGHAGHLHHPHGTIQSYVIATKLGWHPANVITNSVSATVPFLTIAKQSGSDITDGTITVNYLLDPSNPVYNNTPGMKLYRQIMAKYDAKGNANDPLNLYGVAKAWTTVQVLKAAGKNLTRAGLMQVVRKMSFSSERRTRIRSRCRASTS